MRKSLVLSAAFGLITTLMWPSIAPADQPAGPGGNAGAAKNNCIVAGGVYAGTNGFPTPGTCTIVTQKIVWDNIPASHPKQAWTIDVEKLTERTEVYSYAGGGSPWVTEEDMTETLSQEVQACYNHQGHRLGDDAYLTNPNCQPAADSM